MVRITVAWQCLIWRRAACDAPGLRDVGEMRTCSSWKADWLLRQRCAAGERTGHRTHRVERCRGHSGDAFLLPAAPEVAAAAAL